MLKKVLFLALSCVLLVSCSEKDVFFKLKSTTGSWHKDSIVEFNFETRDTVTVFNMFLHIRNTESYKYNNLFVITSLYYPMGKVEVDTLEYYMAYPDGRLMGEGMGSLKYNKLWYREGYRFTEPGEYKITIRHAMRAYNTIEPLTELDGVEEVGFSYKPQIELNNEQKEKQLQ